MIKQINILNIGKNVIKSELNALKKLNKSINKSFLNAVNLINYTKGNIVFTGVGKSKLILEKTCGTFSSLGLPSYTLDPTAASHGDLGRLQQRDTLIVASNSGNSREFESILKFANKTRIKVIGITSNKKSKLFKNSFIKILHPKVKEAGDKNFSMVPTSSTTLLAALGDALAIAVAKKRGFKISNFGEYHPKGSIGKSLTKVKDLLILKSKIIYIKENTSFSDTLKKIAKSRLGCVLIKNKKNKISIITDGDAARAASRFKDIKKLKAKNFMTRNPQFIDESILIPEALKILNKKRINVLLVKNNKKFTGLISLHSIIEFLNT